MLQPSRARHHAMKKRSPAQLKREIAEALEGAPSGMTPEQIARYRRGRRWPADLAFKVAVGRPLSRTSRHSTKRATCSGVEQFGPRPISRRKNVRHFSEAPDKRGVTHYFVTYEDRSGHEITSEELQRFRQREQERGR
jgi:hypothetical protein